MTTINESLTPLGDGFRNLYGTTDKYSAAEMTKLLSGLQIHNLLDDGQSYDSKTDNNAWKGLLGLSVDKWNQYLLGKTVTSSFDVEWSGFSKGTNQDRVGFEIQTAAEDDTHQWYGPWLWPATSAGKQHFLITQTIYGKPIKSIDYGNLYNQLNPEAVVKITNVKMVVNPLGGSATRTN